MENHTCFYLLEKKRYYLTDDDCLTYVRMICFLQFSFQHIRIGGVGYASVSEIVPALYNAKRLLSMDIMSFPEEE